MVKENQTLEGEKPEGDKPAYRGKLDVALWRKDDKNGNTYYTMKIGNIANLFQVTEKVPVEKVE